MSLADNLTQPLSFTPIFQERVWGGRRLESLFGKALPPAAKIGESWEIVDRAEAQSVVAGGALAGRTLHELWTEQRAEIFGEIAPSDRFPLLIKLLDAQDVLSLQVHPPADVAEDLGGEPKTECWYIADAAPGAELFVGLRRGATRARVEQALHTGGLEQQVHRVAARAGDTMFLPSGRMHAIGAGYVIFEIQQNSDTTYRIYDWDRVDENGVGRKLHVEESLRSIDFDDFEPGLAQPAGETLVRDPLFRIDKWELTAPRAVSPRGTFAILGGLAGKFTCAGAAAGPGEFLLVPAALAERELRPLAADTSLLRITLDPP